MRGKLIPVALLVIAFAACEQQRSCKCLPGDWAAYSDVADYNPPKPHDDGTVHASKIRGPEDGKFTVESMHDLDRRFARQEAFDPATWRLRKDAETQFVRSLEFCMKVFKSMDGAYEVDLSHCPIQPGVAMVDEVRYAENCKVYLDLLRQERYDRERANELAGKEGR